MVALSKITGIGHLVFWLGCGLTVFFAIVFLMRFLFGAPKLPTDLHLHDTYYVSYPWWVHVLPLVGAVLILISGTIMKIAESNADEFIQKLDEGNDLD